MTRSVNRSISSYSTVSTARFGEPVDRQLDIGCALKHGVFDVVHDEHGEVWINRSAPDVSLIFFLLRLFTRLQALGTVPAIDPGLYAKTLEA
jgi:hypothetical protein